MNGTDVVSRILSSCLDATAGRPQAVRAAVHQREGYVRGSEGLAWERVPHAADEDGEFASAFLGAVRRGDLVLRGRIKAELGLLASAFAEGVCQGFPAAKKKAFLGPLSRLWIRWTQKRGMRGVDPADVSRDAGLRVGLRLREEYEEGVAGGLSRPLLDRVLHLRGVRAYLRMNGWFAGAVRRLEASASFEERYAAKVLSANAASIVLRAVHNGDPAYASRVVSRFPALWRDFHAAIARIADPESRHLLENYKLTVIAYALHSGYLDYPERLARVFPGVMSDVKEGLDALAPDEAGRRRKGLNAAIYRALTNGRVESLRTHAA